MRTKTRKTRVVMLSFEGLDKRIAPSGGAPAPDGGSPPVMIGTPPPPAGGTSPIKP